MVVETFRTFPIAIRRLREAKGGTVDPASVYSGHAISPFIETEPLQGCNECGDSVTLALPAPFHAYDLKTVIIGRNVVVHQYDYVSRNIRTSVEVGMTITERRIGSCSASVRQVSRTSPTRPP